MLGIVSFPNESLEVVDDISDIISRCVRFIIKDVKKWSLRDASKELTPNSFCREQIKHLFIQAMQSNQVVLFDPFIKNYTSQYFHSNGNYMISTPMEIM